jgi:hypothetical protein
MTRCDFDTYAIFVRLFRNVTYFNFDKQKYPAKPKNQIQPLIKQKNRYKKSTLLKPLSCTEKPVHLSVCCFRLCMTNCFEKVFKYKNTMDKGVV